MSALTADQRSEIAAMIREALIVHSIGATICAQVARRHFTLFYAECDARRAELDAATPADRDKLLLSIGAESHEQESAERQAAERAADPDHLTVADRLLANIDRLIR